MLEYFLNCLSGNTFLKIGYQVNTKGNTKKEPRKFIPFLLMIGITCIYPEYEDYLIKNKIRYEKCYSKKSKRLWLKIHPMDESNHWDFFHSIDTYVKFVLDD
tara:strand:- start:912 stop:1217 length:306 start_codon:yes stop_codon:yes gene_type:complete